MLSHRVCHNSAFIYSTEAAIDNIEMECFNCVLIKLYIAKFMLFHLDKKNIK